MNDLNGQINCIREFYLPELIDETYEEASKEPLKAVSVPNLIMHFKEHFKRKTTKYYPLSLQAQEQKKSNLQSRKLKKDRG